MRQVNIIEHEEEDHMNDSIYSGITHYLSSSGCYFTGVFPIGGNIKISFIIYIVYKHIRTERQSHRE